MGFDKMSEYNIDIHPPVARRRAPPPGFKAAVKKFMDALIYNVGGLTRDLWPDGTTTLQNYLAMLSDWLQDRGLRYGAYGLAAATIALIARAIYNNGSDALKIRAIRRAYQMSGLGCFVQYTTAWCEAIGNRISNMYESARKYSNQLYERMMDYAAYSLVSIGGRISALGRRLRNRNRNTTATHLQNEDGEMEELAPESVPTNTTATEDDSWLKEFVDDATIAYNQDVFENIGLRDVFPAASATRTDEQTNHIDDITNSDISTIPLGDLVKKKTPAGKVFGSLWW